jgi:NAD-dependent histone deacetylase SIR2
LVDAAAASAKPGGGARKKSPKFHYDDDSSSDSDAEDDDVPTAGVMKPDITFFGEDLPNTFFSRFNTLDCGAADLVVVIGTSMQVAPVAKMPDKLAQAGREDVPCIYIGREPCNHIEFDVQLIGDCDAVVWELARRAGWELRHEMIPKGGLELEVREMEGDKKGRWTVTRKGAVGGVGV